MVLTQPVFVNNCKAGEKFPYHYGSHATDSRPSCSSSKTSFHTTMVLTQRTHGQVVPRQRRVSIPLWFSRNRNRRHSCRQKRLRFHTTMVLTQRRGVAGLHPYSLRFHTTMVLTQHWMDHRSQGSHVFPYHYGSHATKFFCRVYLSMVVSIPLWFSRNINIRNNNGFTYESFHTTMVLTQQVR